MTATKNFLFESMTCPRCGGCGEYSYCQMYGTRCFKCRGDGSLLTKRGRAAQDYFTDLCSVPAAELTMGQLVWTEYFVPTTGATSYAFAPVVSIEVNGDSVTFTTEKEGLAYGPVTYSGVAASKLVRVAQSAEEKQAKIDKAMLFQSQLKEDGTVYTKLQPFRTTKQLQEERSAKRDVAIERKEAKRQAQRVAAKQNRLQAIEAQRKANGGRTDVEQAALAYAIAKGLTNALWALDESRAAFLMAASRYATGFGADVLQSVLRDCRMSDKQRYYIEKSMPKCVVAEIQ